MKKFFLVILIATLTPILSILNLNALEVPTAVIDNIVETDSTISFDYSLVDSTENVIMHTQEYSPTVAIYENGNLVQEQEAIETTNTEKETVIFENLNGNTSYEIAINAPYDLLGEGIPYNDAPYTLINESVNTFKIAATGYVHTTIEENPTNPGYSNIEVVYDLIDDQDTLLYGTGDNPRLSLYDGNLLVDSIEIQEGEDQTHNFTNLDPNKRYHIELTGLVDLNDDGEAENSDSDILASREVTTDNTKIIPTASIHQIDGDEPSIIATNTIEVHYDIIDQDNALVYKDTIRPKINMYKDGELESSVNAEIGTNMVHTFTTSGYGEYKIEVRGQYDLNEDGITDNPSPYILDEENFTAGIPDGYTVVSTCKDLESIGRGANYAGASHVDSWPVNGNYALINDIDCSATNPSDPNHGTTPETTYGSNGFDPIVLFSGNFTGLDFSVNDMYINESKSEMALFSSVTSTGKVSNVAISNAKIIGSNNSAILVGSNQGIVENSFTSGNVQGKENVGGLVGYNYNIIQNSVSQASVNGTDDVGGLVGYSIDSEIKNSYSTGLIDGNFQIIDEGGQSNDTGGLVGGLEDSVLTNSFSTANTSGGSLIGEVYGTSEVTNSFATGKSDDGLIESLEKFTGNISNSFQYDQAICSVACSDYPTVSFEQLNSVQWYLDEMKFDENWDLNSVNDGYFPIVMKTDFSSPVVGQQNILIP